MISTTPLDIIGITETWMDTAGSDFKGEYHLPGYLMFHGTSSSVELDVPELDVPGT